MTDEECRKLGIMTDQELKDMDLRWYLIEESGIADTQPAIRFFTILSVFRPRRSVADPAHDVYLSKYLNSGYGYLQLLLTKVEYCACNQNAAQGRLRQTLRELGVS